MEMTIQAAAQFLYREALLLDSRRWDEWLAMFTEDCEFWVPSWRDEDSITEDPKRELCLIFYAGRSGLEERVWRARSGRSVASAVLPRTSHSIHNVWTEPPGDGKAAHDAVRVHSVWTVHQFRPKDKGMDIFFGRYEHILVPSGGSWHITSKKVVLLNDYLPARIDFYSL